MQDLSKKVQSIASRFYQTRNNTDFTTFYKVLLPEAHKMLRNFIRDSQTIEDISSKIFETILVKPSIYFDDDTQKQFGRIAEKLWNVTGDQIEKCSDCFRRMANGDGIDIAIPMSTVGKLWLLINHPRIYADKATAITEDNLIGYDLEQLSNLPAPFIYDLDKPFLHYFSRIVKTNALSHLKKAKKYQDQQFADMYAGYDDDDKPQLLANQLSDESEKNDVSQCEINRQLDEQKFMIIYDIIQQTVPENQRGIMIDAILLKLDYAQIAQKHGLIRIEVDREGVFKVTGITKSTISYEYNDGEKLVKETLTLNEDSSNISIHMGPNDRVTSVNSVGEERTFRLIDGTGCLKSRVHRYTKRLDQEIAKTPQFTTQCNIDVFTTYYSDNRIRMQVDVVETEVDGATQSIWHGHYVSRFSTGEIKEMGRYFLGKKQGIWYTFFKNGQILKRGMYSADKQDGKWHYFDIDGKLDSLISFHQGQRGYYELHQENNEVITGIWDSERIPEREPKPALNDILASKLCSKYDSEFSYQGLHFKILQEH